MRVIQLEELRRDDSNNKYGNDCQQEADANPHQALGPEDRLEEMRSGIDAQSRQVNNDTELAHHQVRALSRIGGQVNPGAKCAHQDADNDRTASDAQLDRRVHARQEDGDRSNQDTKRQSDKDGQQIWVVKSLHLIAQYLADIIHRVRLADDCQPVANLQAKVFGGQQVDARTVYPCYIDSVKIAETKGAQLDTVDPVARDDDSS